MRPFYRSGDARSVRFVSRPRTLRIRGRGGDVAWRTVEIHGLLNATRSRMAKKRSKKKTTMTRKPRKLDRWAELTWQNLHEWAGATTVSRGRNYQKEGRVHDLCISARGELVAWVEGGMEYATRVRLEWRRKKPAGLSSSCSCPVEWDCKHAVAVVAEVLDALGKERDVLLASDDDRRWALAEQRTSPGPVETEELQAEGLDSYLRQQRKDQLVELLLELCEYFPELGVELQRRRLLGEGAVSDLVEQARREIAALTAQESWRNNWTGAGEIPDYDSLERLLEALRDHGEHDALVSLGQELFVGGQEQVDQSHDDGETGMAISGCLTIVFESVPKSTLSDPEKIRYAIDMLLADGYGIADGAESILLKKWSRRAWSTVADDLCAQLDELSAGEGFRSRYRRDRRSDAAIMALDRAGREDEALELCKCEAPLTESYLRLVTRLLEAGSVDEAEDWAQRGYGAVVQSQRGTASRLRDQLREIARGRKDWQLVAAYAAEEFFELPGVERLAKLFAAARKAKCEERVRAAALRFLETGRLPSLKGKSRKKGAAWPLPDTGLVAEPEDPEHPRGPYLDVLRDLAIDEGRAEDVLRWHDRIPSFGRTGRRHCGEDGVRVARAVADEFPDRAIELYLEAAESAIAGLLTYAGL